MTLSSWPKILVGAVLFMNALQQLSSNFPWWFMKNVNLIFHEAGHIFMMPFGRTLYILGGSLFETGLPLLIVLYFAFKKQYLSAAFGAWWLSTALLSVSIYAADAGERALPLLGGDSVGHDWFNLLLDWNLLHRDDVFGYGFWLGGLCATFYILYFTYCSLLIKPHFPTFSTPH